MAEFIHTKTGLEMCFEAELSKLPGWRTEFVEFRDAKAVQKPQANAQDEAVEEKLLPDG
jgi:hypothetical protein